MTANIIPAYSLIPERRIQRPITINLDPHYGGFGCNGCNQHDDTIAINVASMMITLCPRCLDRLHNVIEAEMQRQKEQTG